MNCYANHTKMIMELGGYTLPFEMSLKLKKKIVRKMYKVFYYTLLFTQIIKINNFQVHYSAYIIPNYSSASIHCV